MTITLNIPEDIAEDLRSPDRDLSREALVSLGIEGYRAGRLSEEQVRRMLGFESRFQVHALLKEHSVFLQLTEDDILHDLDVARRLAPE